MSARINYIGNSQIRKIKQATLVGLGLSDPGADLVWNQANGFSQVVNNDIAVFLLAQGDFAHFDGLNYGPAASLLTGSGVVLNSVTISSQFVMTTAGTAEDVPGCTNIGAVFDGRPWEIFTTPLATSKDQAASGLIQLRVLRQSDGALQRTFYRQQESVANTINPHKVEMVGLTAWPSDGVPFVVGQTYSVKLNITAPAGNKAATNGNTQPFTFGIRTC